MTDNFNQLVSNLTVSSSSSNILITITYILQEQTLQSMPLFVSTSMESLLTLENWVWQVLSEDFRRWINEQSYCKLFHTLNLFNIQLVSIKESIPSETKAILLIPSNTAWIDGIFNQIETNNDIFLTMTNCWFDTLSYFVQEYPDSVYSPNIIHINHRISRDFVMTNQYKSYLQQLGKSSISSSILTKKLMFYLKTCSFSLKVYFWSKTQDFLFTAREIIQFLGRDYSQMILVQSEHLNQWHGDLLSCVAHITGFICSTCWWGGQKSENIDIIIPPTDSIYTHILAFIRIVSYQPFHRYLSVQGYYDENILIDSTLILLVGAVETQNLGCFITSKTDLPATLLTIAQKSIHDRICLCAYGFLAGILSDTQLKELKIADNISRFFFDVLEKAWKHSTKKWKKIPINYILKGLLSLSSNDAIQNATAQLQKIPLFIELSDHYLIVYDIIWSLSFNPSIQDQLRSNRPFMAKLAKLELETNEPKISKAVNGLLWVLNATHRENEVSGINEEIKFDLMISYAHKEKDICKQLYDELIQANYRVWIDFDQMHGSIMDAMAQAIEQSKTIILCMSEQYQRSNYCRAEAQYAFKRKSKIVPILVQKYYKPDGWLSFLVSPLLYIDFTKYEFSQALQMLFKELKLNYSQTNTALASIRSNSNSEYKSVHSSSCQVRLSSQTIILPEKVQDWTTAHVQQWLIKNDLSQMAHILSDTDGLSLIYLSQYIVNGEPQQILSLLQQDSLRHNQTLSLVDISRFRSLIEREGLAKLNLSEKVHHLITAADHSRCCEIM